MIARSSVITKQRLYRYGCCGTPVPSRLARLTGSRANQRTGHLLMARRVLTMERQTSTTASKIQNSFLTCSVCFEVYTNPKCLPCLHTFCYHCLLSYIESMAKYGFRAEKGFPCPVCKQKVDIENYRNPFDEWLDELPNNFLIQNMIDCLVHKKPAENDKQDAPKDPTPQKLPTQISQGPRPLFALPLPVAPSNMPSAPPAEDRSGMSSHTLRSARPIYSRTLSNSASDLHSGNDSTGAAALVPHRHNAFPLSRGIPRGSRVAYRDTDKFQKVYHMTAKNWCDYKPTILSDVICLPKHNGIIVLDYDNRCVKYVKNVFLGRNVTTATEVVGRPCCVSLLDKNEESIVVVSVLNRKKLYFIRVPELTLVDIIDTRREYHGLTVLSNTMILAGSECSTGQPACLDLIKIDHRCKLQSTTTIYQSGNWRGRWNMDVYRPNYITALSEHKFVVSDAQRNCLVFFDIADNYTKAVHRFSLLPSEYQPFLDVGGMCYHNGYLYFVDREAHEVHKVSMEDRVVCETILKQRSRDGIWRPSSVCVGPRGEICVVNWEGKVTIFKPK